MTSLEKLCLSAECMARSGAVAGGLETGEAQHLNRMAKVIRRFIDGVTAIQIDTDDTEAELSCAELIADCEKLAKGELCH